MTDAVNLGEGGVLASLSEQAIDFPRAFGPLTDMLSLDMDDPDTAFGVLQGPALWFQLELNEDERIELLTLANDDAALLYLLLRAHSFGLWHDDDRRGDGLLAAARGDMDWKLALEYVASFIPGFGTRALLKIIGIKFAKAEKAR